MASKVFAQNLSEEQTDAGVKEARAEGPRFATLKERARKKSRKIPDRRAMESFMSAFGAPRAKSATDKAQDVMYQASNR